MNEIIKWRNSKKAKKMYDILIAKHYDAHIAENLDDAREMVIKMIPEGSSVALGGSVTTSDMGIIEILRNGNYKFLDRYEKGLPYMPDIVEIHRQSLTADIYITGTNAVTKNGELVNVDCTGNRVAAMIFGPKRVIIVTGVNKLVNSLEEALTRLKEIAPLNSKRIGHKTPCVETGFCVDCDCKARMCNYTTIIHNGWKFENRISIVIVPEELGF